MFNAVKVWAAANPVLDMAIVGACIIAIAGCGGMVATEESRVDASSEGSKPDEQCPAPTRIGAPLSGEAPKCPATAPADGTACPTEMSGCGWAPADAECGYLFGDCVGGHWRIVSICGDAALPEGA